MEALKFVSFDIEITKEIPKGETDWKALRPLGISCAATLTSDGDLRLWHGELLNPLLALVAGSREIEPSMGPSKCAQLAAYLVRMQNGGYPILTWNGLGFDFDILAEECQDWVAKPTVIDLALGHIDMAFAMLCAKGFMIGLDTAAKGMGVGGKTEGMHGSLAPQMWAMGREEQSKVLAYVAQDVKATANVYRAICAKGCLTWISRSGRLNFWRVVPYRIGYTPSIPTVLESLKTPEPDTAWMSDPWHRSKFYGWTGWGVESNDEAG